MSTVRLSSAEGRAVLASSILGSSVAFLDQMAVNTALPTLGAEFGAPLSGLQWIIDAYLLMLGAVLLSGGALGDRFGQRRVFQIGLLGFGGASALCAASSTLPLLIAARSLQGLAAALLVPSSLALVQCSFTQADRGIAIGTWAGLSGLTSAAGPLLGGYLVTLSWRWIFLINVPVIAIATVLSRRSPPIAPDRARAVDLRGAALSACGLGALVFALIEGPTGGLSELGAVVLAATGVVLLVVFVVLEARGAHPMLPLSLFRSRAFSGANALTLAVYFALGGTTFLLVLVLQRAEGYSPVAAGAALLPLTVCILLLSPIAGRLTHTVGARTLMTIGISLVGLGVALLGPLRAPGGYWVSLFPGTLLLGLGLSATVAPLTATVLAAVDDAHAGIASGVNNAVSRLAGMFAVAVLPWTARFDMRAVDPAALEAGLRRALAVCAGACVVGAILAFATIPGRRRSDLPSGNQ